MFINVFILIHFEILVSRSGEYEDGCLLERYDV
jgi:hypothetical protein